MDEINGHSPLFSPRAHLEEAVAEKKIVSVEITNQETFQPPIRIDQEDDVILDWQRRRQKTSPVDLDLVHAFVQKLPQ